MHPEGACKVKGDPDEPTLAAKQSWRSPLVGSALTDLDHRKRQHAARLPSSSEGIERRKAGYRAFG